MNVGAGQMSTKRENLTRWAKKYPRHFWALHKMSKNDELRKSFLEQLLEHGFLTPGQMKVLWRDADQLEWSFQSGEPPPLRYSEVDTQIMIKSHRETINKITKEEVLAVEFTAFPAGWRGRFEIPVRDVCQYADIEGRRSDLAYIKGQVEWQKGGYTIVKPHEITISRSSYDQNI